MFIPMQDLATRAEKKVQCLLWAMDTAQKLKWYISGVEVFDKIWPKVTRQSRIPCDNDLYTCDVTRRVGSETSLSFFVVYDQGLAWIRVKVLSR